MGSRLEAIPTRDLPAKNEKNAVSQLNIISFPLESTKKKQQKQLLQTPPVLVKSNEQSLNVKFTWISSHPQEMG